VLTEYETTSRPRRVPCTVIAHGTKKKKSSDRNRFGDKNGAKR